MDAEFRHGHPLQCDYTPGADVAAGTVIMLAKMPVVAHRDIAANTLGAVAVRGGVYRLVANEDLAPGDKVYIIEASKKLTKTAAAGAHEHFGFVAPASNPAVDGDPVDAIHAPDGTAI